MSNEDVSKYDSVLKHNIVMGFVNNIKHYLFLFFNIINNVVAHNNNNKTIMFRCWLVMTSSNIVISVDMNSIYSSFFILSNRWLYCLLVIISNTILESSMIYVTNIQIITTLYYYKPLPWFIYTQYIFRYWITIW